MGHEIEIVAHSFDEVLNLTDHLVEQHNQGVNFVPAPPDRNPSLKITIANGADGGIEFSNGRKNPIGIPNASHDTNCRRRQSSKRKYAFRYF